MNSTRAVKPRRKKSSPLKLVPPLAAAPPPVPQWIYQTQLMKITPRSDGRSLAVMVQNVGADPCWQVMSVETIALRRGADAKEEDAIVEEVFADHAHKIVGRYDTLVRGLAAADSFAAAWVKKHKGTHHASCSCGEMP